MQTITPHDGDTLRVFSALRPPAFISATLRICFLINIAFWSAGKSFADDVGSAHVCVFNISTFVPITTGTVDSECSEQWTIANPSKIAELLLILKAGPHREFNENNVRAHIVLGDRIYFIDSRGIVKAGNSSYKIDMQKLREFRRALQSSEISSAHLSAPF